MGPCHAGQGIADASGGHISAMIECSNFKFEERAAACLVQERGRLRADHSLELAHEPSGREVVPAWQPAAPWC